MRIAALTVNWRRAADTLACLETLRVQQPAPKIFVVDNASGDDSVARLQAGAPDVTLICSERNRGFSGGYNLGLRAALDWGAEAVLMVNNDTLLAPDMLPELLRWLAPDVGAVAPFIYYADAPDIVWASGGSINRWTLEKYDAWANRTAPPNLPPVVARDFLTGCALLLPRSTLEQVGLFDEGFWLYYEDMDFARRIRRAGLRLLLATRARLWHKVSLSSGGSDSPNERYWMARSSVRFFGKHSNLVQRAVIVPYRLGSALRTSWRLWRAGRADALQAYWRGLRDGLRGGW